VALVQLNELFQIQPLLAQYSEDVVQILLDLFLTLNAMLELIPTTLLVVTYLQATALLCE
jgi:hypothetical protein